MTDLRPLPPLPEPTDRHAWLTVLVLFVVFVVVPLWIAFRVLRWFLRVSYWSGYNAGLRR